MGIIYVPMKPNSAPTSKPSVPLPSSKRGLKGYFAETGRELRKVNWPTKQETTRLTGVVLSVCFMITVALLALGFVFEQIIKLITTGSL